jgi:Cytochrome P460
VAVSHETGLDELRVILGNPLTMKAYSTGKLPFPDGAIFVKLAWKHAPLAGSEGTFVAGAPTTVQVMVKDSERYASTGGWEFGRFINGAPVDTAQHQTCFSCHQAGAGSQDFVFTRYAPCLKTLPPPPPSSSSRLLPSCLAPPPRT